MEEMTLSLANIEREALGLPVGGRWDALGLRLGDEVLLVNQIVAGVVEELRRGEEDRPARRSERPAAEAPTPRGPDRRLVRAVAEALDNIDGRYRYTRADAAEVLGLELKLEAAFEMIARALAPQLLERPLKVEAIRPARAGEHAVYVSDAPIHGAWTRRRDGVERIYINVEPPRPWPHLLRTLSHEIAHAAGLSEEQAERFSRTLVS